MAEYFDLLDNNGKLTGKKKLREEVHRDGDWHRAVNIWVKNSKGQYLLQKRAPNKDSFPNYWDTSAGGHVKSGQDYLAAALTELAEELGLKVDSSELQSICVYKIRKLSDRCKFKNNEFIHLYLLEKDLDLSKVKFQAEEISALKWVNWKELTEFIKSKKHILTPTAKIDAKFLLENNF